MSSVVKSRGLGTQQFNTDDRERMKQYGFIYADGSYSDEREQRGAFLVPRRPSEKHLWDPDSREWYLDGEVMPPETGTKQESIGGDNPGKPPTLEQVQKANKPAGSTSVAGSPVPLPGVPSA